MLTLLSLFDLFGYQPSFETDSDDVETLNGDRPTFPSHYVDPRGIVDLCSPLPLPVYEAIATIEPSMAPDIVAAINASGCALATMTQVILDDATVTSIKARPSSCSKWTAVCDGFAVDKPRRSFVTGCDTIVAA